MKPNIVIVNNSTLSTFLRIGTCLTKRSFYPTMVSVHCPSTTRSTLLCCLWTDRRTLCRTRQVNRKVICSEGTAIGEVLSGSQVGKIYCAIVFSSHHFVIFGILTETKFSRIWRNFSFFLVYIDVFISV